MAQSYAEFLGVEVVEEVEKAMNRALVNFLFNTQSDLSKAAPVDTGRLASGFVLGKDTPNREVEPEREQKGEVTLTRQYNKSEITMDSDWYISNNVPYARRVAYDPIYGKGGRVGSAAWYTTIENNLQRKANEAFTRQLKKVK